MNPGQQLHRSLTFWAGLFLILFTCWAWRDSRSHITLVHWKQVEVNSTLDGIIISRFSSRKKPYEFTRRDRGPENNDAHYGHFDPPFLVRKKPQGEPDPTARSYLQQNQQVVINVYGPGSWVLFIPYWLILPPIILIWTALLLFRARRRRRAITPALNEAAS